MGLILGSVRSPGGEHGNPLQYSCLENPHEHRSLVGYSPQGRTESDTTGVTEHAHIGSSAVRNGSQQSKILTGETRCGIHAYSLYYFCDYSKKSRIILT